MVIWGGASKNNQNSLRIQQNSIICIYLKKDILTGSTYLRYKQNWMSFRLNRSTNNRYNCLYKKRYSFFIIKQYDKPMLRKVWLFNITVIYTNTSFGQKFINHHLDTVNFNSLPILMLKKILLMEMPTRRIVSTMFCITS